MKRLARKFALRALERIAHQTTHLDRHDAMEMAARWMVHAHHCSDCTQLL